VRPESGRGDRIKNQNRTFKLVCGPNGASFRTKPEEEKKAEETRTERKKKGNAKTQEKYQRTALPSGVRKEKLRLGGGDAKGGEARFTKKTRLRHGS